MSTRDENMIAALRRERGKYLAEGKDDRVEQVDDQLRRLGYNPEDEETGRPQGRTPQNPAQQTAERNTEQSSTAGTGDAAPADTSSVNEAGSGDGDAAAQAEAKPPAKKAAAARRSAVKE